jgi:hypothetical protein
MRTRISVTVLLTGLVTALFTMPSASAGESGRAKHRTSFLSRGPAPTIGAPFCDAEQHCLYPGTRNATYEGDWVGTGIAVGAAAIGEGAHFGGPVLWLFAGTIEHCGSGTLVYAVIETGDAAAMSGKGTWQIIEGFGTGDLANVSGRGNGAGSVSEGSRFKGVIRCLQE